MHSVIRGYADACPAVLAPRLRETIVARNAGPLHFGVATLFAVLSIAGHAANLPQDGSVVAGSVEVEALTATRLALRQSSHEAVIDWRTFDIAQGAHVEVEQPSSTALLLNRVTGDAPSTLAGTLHANGTILLVNPNGIEITSTGAIDSGSFAASTHDIEDADAEHLRVRALPLLPVVSREAASIVSAGAIRVTPGGTISLEAERVEQSGSLRAEAGTIALHGGRLHIAGDIDVASRPGAAPGEVQVITHDVRIVPRASIAGARASAAGSVIEAGTLTQALEGGNVSVVAQRAPLSTAAAARVAAAASQDATIPAGAGSRNDPADIHIDAKIAWFADTALSLDSAGRVVVHAPVLVSGARGGVHLRHGERPGTGVQFDFGSLQFAGPHAALTIQGQPYRLIYTESQLRAIGDAPMHYALARSMRMSSLPFLPVARHRAANVRTLEGLGNRIEHLSIALPDSARVGLFSMLQGNVAVKNLVFVSPRIVGAERVGVLAGEIRNGVQVSDVTVRDGKVTAMRQGMAGGIVGILGERSAVRSARLDGAYVSGNSDVGGVAGWVAPSARISHALVQGEIKGASHVGGVAGTMRADSELAMSCFTGSIVHAATDSRVQPHAFGGLAGALVGARIVRSHTNGLVSGGDDAGGLAGEVRGGAVIEASVAKTCVMGGENVGGLVGSVGATDRLSGNRVDGNQYGQSNVGTVCGNCPRGANDDTTVSVASKTVQLRPAPDNVSSAMRLPARHRPSALRMRAISEASSDAEHDDAEVNEQLHVATAPNAVAHGLSALRSPPSAPASLATTSPSAQTEAAASAAGEAPAGVGPAAFAVPVPTVRESP